VSQLQFFWAAFAVRTLFLNYTSLNFLIIEKIRDKKNRNGAKCS